jgi:transketolase-like protein
MVGRAMEAAEALGGERIEVTVIDPRTLVPLDVETLVRAAESTAASWPWTRRSDAAASRATSWRRSPGAIRLPRGAARPRRRAGGVDAQQPADRGCHRVAVD